MPANKEGKKHVTLGYVSEARVDRWFAAASKHGLPLTVFGGQLLDMATDGSRVVLSVDLGQLERHELAALHDAVPDDQKPVVYHAFRNAGGRPTQES